MIVEVQETIKGSREAVWAVITNIEHAPAFISGIDKIEIVDQPAGGLLGLRWRETRMLFGKPATVEKSITQATDLVCFTARAESEGFVFLCTKRIADCAGGVTLTEIHDSRPQGLVAKIMNIPMSLFFKGGAKKAVRQDIIDIKTAVER